MVDRIPRSHEKEHYDQRLLLVRSLSFQSIFHDTANLYSVSLFLLGLSCKISGMGTTTRAVAHINILEKHAHNHLYSLRVPRPVLRLGHTPIVSFMDLIARVNK